MPQQHVRSPSRSNLGQSQQKQPVDSYPQQNEDRSDSSSLASVYPLQREHAPQIAALDMQDIPCGLDAVNVPPLNHNRFLALLQEWWGRSGITFDPGTLTIGNRQIDIDQLHQLHVAVLQLGGAVNVRSLDPLLHLKMLITSFRCNIIACGMLSPPIWAGRPLLSKNLATPRTRLPCRQRPCTAVFYSRSSRHTWLRR